MEHGGGSGFVLTPGTLVAGRHFAGHENYFLEETINVQFGHPDYVSSPTINGYGHARITKMILPFEPFEQELNFTGGIQEVTVGPGTYHVQTWGAQGGRNQHAGEPSLGRGGFSEGIIVLDTETTLYVVVGGRGLDNTNGGDGGFNGGGATTQRSNGAGSGGGATHISKSSGLLNNQTVRDDIIVVAGAGGGRGGAGTAGNGGAGGTGGGLTGGTGASFGGGTTRNGGFGGSQIAGGNHGEWANRPTNQPGPANNGSAGLGGNGVLDTNNAFSSGGGGRRLVWRPEEEHLELGGGGGSSHIANLDSGYGIMARTISGTASMPTHNGMTTMIGNEGDGFAKITRIDPTAPFSIMDEVEIDEVDDEEYVEVENEYVEEDYEYTGEETDNGLEMDSGDEEPEMEEGQEHSAMFQSNVRLWSNSLRHMYAFGVERWGLFTPT